MINKNPNINMWETAQKLIWYQTKDTLPYRLTYHYTDTSDLYEYLLDNILPEQYDNLHKIICRKKEPFDTNSYYYDGHDVYQILEANISEYTFKFKRNNKDIIVDTFEDGVDRVFETFKLIPKKTYHNKIRQYL